VPIRPALDASGGRNPLPPVTSRIFVLSRLQKLHTLSLLTYERYTNSPRVERCLALQDVLAGIRAGVLRKREWQNQLNAASKWSLRPDPRFPVPKHSPPSPQSLPSPDRPDRDQIVLHRLESCLAALEPFRPTVRSVQHIEAEVQTCRTGSPVNLPGLC
jgi:hypothetical protein